MTRKTYGWGDDETPVITTWPIPGSASIRDISPPAGANVAALVKTITELVANHNALLEMLRAYEILERP